MPLLPPSARLGRPREHPWREILNAIFYITRSGCAWRLDGSWERWSTALREAMRLKANRHRQPNAAILDSQSVKTVEGGTARL